MPKLIDSEVQERFIELRAKNFSYEKISRELNVSKPTLISWGRKFQIEVENRRAIEKEVLMEQYYVSWAKRVQLFGQQIESFQKELKNRDLSEIPTEKLLELQLKYMDKLKAEESEIILQDNDDSLDSLLKQASVVKWKA